MMYLKDLKQAQQVITSLHVARRA